MPLTKLGRKVRFGFVQEYGKKRGTNIFYAYMHKHPRATRKFHLMKGGLK